MLASGRIWTLNLSVMSWVFYHCATNSLTLFDSTSASTTSGLYYKHTTIVNYASSVVSEQIFQFIDDAWVVIYDRHVFIVQATG